MNTHNDDDELRSTLSLSSIYTTPWKMVDDEYWWATIGSLAMARHARCALKLLSVLCSTRSFFPTEIQLINYTLFLSHQHRKPNNSR